MLAQLGLIGTLRDEDQSPEEPDTESEPEEGPIVLNRKKKQGPRSCRDFNCDFEFVETDRPSRDEAWAMADVMSQLKKKRSLTTLDQKIETIRKKRKAEDKQSPKEGNPSASEKEEEEKLKAEEDENDDNDDDDDDDDDDDGEKNGQENEDDVGNLQLAWEMLEVAKLIYKRKEGKEEQLMAAQAHLKLGEVGAETGNYPQALEDFQECLAIQLQHLPPHSRLLAETHYHVATTLCYMDEYRQAIQHYNSSIEVIENRLSVLQKAIDAAEGDGGAAEEKSEMEELKQLLPEIREKVEDAKESLRTASAASQAIQQTLGGTSSSSAFLRENGGPSSSTAAFAESSQDPGKCDSSSSSKAASDISHLVRKKAPTQSASVESSA